MENKKCLWCGSHVEDLKHYLCINCDSKYYQQKK